MTEARTLPVNCPICDRAVDGDLADHLLDTHFKAEVVDELLGYMEADEHGSF